MGLALSKQEVKLQVQVCLNLNWWEQDCANGRCQ
jgi:hypothetical protein